MNKEQTISNEIKAKVLHLTLKKKWFDLIASGEKKEEYRDLKNYWYNRLGYWYESDHETGYWDYGFKNMPDVILFRNGYNKNAPTVLIECVDIRIDKAKPEWSDNLTGEFFVIELGNIISK